MHREIFDRPRGHAPCTRYRMLASSRIGLTLAGKYTLLREIGSGGMSTVFEAMHRNGRRVAVKVLAAPLAWDHDIRERFLREGKTSVTVNHPRVVQVLDDDVAEDGSMFLVMELLDGEDLATYAAARGGKLEEDHALDIARDLLDVLEHAHARGIIHRDIKPENLFLDRVRGLKVLDFGIARTSLRTDPRLHRGQLLGTPGFMAPEQACGEGEDVDARTDLWAVGATLFWLLAGRRVHEGESFELLLAKSAALEPTPLREVAPWVSEETCRFVDRAVARVRDDRFSDATAMKYALDRILDARQDATLVLPRARPHSVPFQSRTRGAAIAGAMLLVALTVFLLVFAKLRPVPTPEFRGITAPHAASSRR